MASAAITFRNEDPGYAPVVIETAKPAGPTAEERIASLERELTETRESQKVWEGIANNRPQQVRQTADVRQAEPADAGIDWGKDEDDDTAPAADTSEALLDDLSKLGADALAKRGFVRTADVRKIAREEGRRAAATAANQVVSRARAEVTSETRLMSEFPELKDQTSELYKLATEHVRDTAKFDPKAMDNPVATLYMAARAAKRELDAKAPKDTRRTGDDDERPTRTARQEHIDAQAGDRGRNRSVVDTGADDTDSGLNEDELSVAKAFGQSAQEYKTEKTRLLKLGGGRGKR